jgi:hypothetical protein
MQDHVSIPDPGGLLVALDAVLADLRTAGLSPVVGVYDLDIGRWIRPAGVAPDGFFGEGVVLRVEGNDHLVSRDDEGVPDAVDVVGFLQDWAMDELGAGWPELQGADGRFVEILLPRTVDGALMWCGKQTNVAVGKLGTVPQA